MVNVWGGECLGGERLTIKFYPGVEIFQPSEEQNLNEIFQLVTEKYSGQFCGSGLMFLEIGWMEIPESSCHAASIVGRGEMA